MNIQEIIVGGGGLLLLLTLIEIAPVKINPWKWAGGACKKAVSLFGRAMNGDVLKELESLKTNQKEQGKRLEEHIRADGERNADQRRTRILRFNNELLRDIKHTKEEFVDALADIDQYEKYCDAHKEYQNNRAVLAIQNIKEIYLERLKKGDFLPDGRAKE